MRAAGGGAVFSVDEEDVRGISTPRSSGDEARYSAEDGSQDSLVGTRRRQMQPDLGFHLNDARRDLDQPQAQGVELRHPPGRASWHGGAQSPEQPVGPGMQEQAELIGGRLAAGRAVGGEMGLPGFDVIFCAAAPAINVLVDRLRSETNTGAS